MVELDYNRLTRKIHPPLPADAGGFPSPDLGGFGFHFFFDGDCHNRVRTFLVPPEHFQKQVHDPPPGFFQIEQETDKSGYDNLPYQRAKTWIYVSKEHKNVV